jgi:hypothetical protein
MLGDFAGGFFEEFVDEGLVGFGLPGGHAAEPAEQLRGDADGDGLFCIPRSGAADSASAAQFGAGRFRNVGEAELAIWHMAQAWRSLRVAWRGLMIPMISLAWRTFLGVQKRDFSHPQADPSQERRGRKNRPAAFEMTVVADWIRRLFGI